MANPPFVVARGSDWNPPLGDAFDQIVKEMAQMDRHRIDFGSAIGGGAFNITDHDAKVITIKIASRDFPGDVFLEPRGTPSGPGNRTGD